MDTGTTAFMLACIIGLTMMIPGLALFYGGMVSVKSSTNMMMMTFGAVAIVFCWVGAGYTCGPRARVLVRGSNAATAARCRTGIAARAWRFGLLVGGDAGRCGTAEFLESVGEVVIASVKGFLGVYDDG